MTATLHTLPRRDPIALRCPSCGGLVPCAGGPEMATPLGVRRYRRCLQCGDAVHTVEVVANWRHPVALAVPAATPVWVLRLCERLARSAAWAAERTR